MTDMKALKASNIIPNRRNQAKAGMIRRNSMNNKINSSDVVNLKPNIRITSQKRHMSNILESPRLCFRNWRAVTI
ncbi:GMC family oxidoreductase [Sesbania bispinosa]|nr:GMC family oxidoreductase [Sesbania bispinosa]